MPTSQNTFYRELVIDLLYRLRLADDLFCQAADAAMSATSLGDLPGKRVAVETSRTYAKALQVIYADFRHVIDGLHVAFPAEASLWQWNEPDGEERFAQGLERLHAIADGMQARLNVELLKQEVRK